MTNEQNAPYEALTTVEDVHSAHDEGRAVECLPPGRTDWLRTFAYGTTVAADLAAGWQYRVALSSPPAAGDAVAWLVMYRGKPVGYATHETRDDVRLAECETLLPVFASPAAPPSVTDAMVERALSAPVRRRTVREIMALRDGADVMLMRAALEAALTHPGHKHAQEDAAREAKPWGWAIEFSDPDPQFDVYRGKECPEGWAAIGFPLYVTPIDSEAK